MGGIVIAKRNDDFFERVRTIQYTGGAVPSPFDCWLVLRGMKTLPLRVRAHSENAAKVADFLAQHRNVERVYYPDLLLRLQICRGICIGMGSSGARRSARCRAAGLSV